MDFDYFIILLFHLFILDLHNMLRTRAPPTHLAIYCSATLFQIFLHHLNLPYDFSMVV